MSRFNHENYRSLNESIMSVQNPHAALQEAMDYAAALESVILDLCEELEIDPDTLCEDLMTPERAAEHETKLKKLRRKYDWNKPSDAALHKAEVQKHKEAKSKTVYGKGGKPAKKGSEDYKRGKQREKDLAAQRRADAARHKEQKAASAAWHRSQADNPEHHAYMAGYNSAADMRRGQEFMRAVGIRQVRGNPFR